jgi:hypothetical protein
MPPEQLRELRFQFEQGVMEFNASALPPPRSEADRLLSRLANDGWLVRTERYKCQVCGIASSVDEISWPECPNCQTVLDQSAPPKEIVFVHEVPQARSVDWVVAVHGMNTSGAWQEAFSWKIGTTWGRSVPVAVYKYGIVIAGVVLWWRRKKLQRDLREKIATLRNEAVKQGFDGRPDLIAHSFGTWLVGHMLRDELKTTDPLRFGRLILAGCILRPDFEWQRLKDAGLVDDVLNHYGTSDMVVPCAHLTIFDSGPSGRRGFDSPGVINIRAEGCGHSDLFSIAKKVNNTTALEDSYRTCWKPFLKLPRAELGALPNRLDPRRAWRPLNIILRGVLFPLFAMPLVLGAAIAFISLIGRDLSPLMDVLIRVSVYSAYGLAALAVLSVANVAFNCAGRKFFDR